VKWLKVLLLGVLSLLLVLFLAGGFLLGTQTGLRWGLDAARGVIPGELQLAGIEGSLLGKLHLRGLSYRNPQMTLEAEDLVLRWQPGKLLYKRLLIDELVLRGIRFEQLQAPVEKEPAQGPGKLPDIELPVALEVKKLLLDDVRIIAAPQSERLLLNRLQLMAKWNEQGLDLEGLSLQAPQADFSVRGQLDPRGDYPLGLDLDWQLHQQDLPALSGTGRLSGDLRQLLLEQHIQGDVAAMVKAHLVQVLDAPRWDADIHLTKLPPEWLPYDREAADLNLELDARGDLEQAEAQMALRLPARKGDAQQAPLKLDLDGRFQFAGQRFEARANWSDLQWPLTGAAQVLSPSGKLSLSGVPDDYRYQVDAALQGRDIPPGDWQAQGQGNRKVSTLKLTGQTLEGVLQADGQLGWSPQPRWDMELQAEGIDPAQLQPDWSGSLDMKLHARGSLPESGLKLNLDIAELAGRLHDHVIGGAGKVQVDGNRVMLEQLRLNSGSARIQADGELAEVWNLQWQLDVPDMAELLPGAKGKIQGQGQLSGTQEKPVVTAGIKARDLLAQGNRCDQCTAQVNFGLDPVHVSHVTIEGKGLNVAAQAMDNLILKLDGPLSAQRLSLAVDHELGKLTFAAVGALDEKQESWSGQIRELAMNMPDFGHWKITKTANLLLSPDKIELDPLCLEDNEGLLCAQVQRKEKSGKARLNLGKFSLKRLRPWLPPEIAGLDGMLTLEATADLQPLLRGSLQASLDGGELIYLDAEQKERSLPLRDGKVEARYDDRALSANWHLGIGEDRMEGKLLIPRKALDADPMNAPLRGGVNLEVNDLNIITAFVPDIEKIEGRADVAVELDGRLGEPRVRGHARLQSALVVVPRAGLELKDLLVEVTGDGSDRLQINGGVKSGEGELQLSGDIGLDAARGWPVRLKLGGHQFLLANLPEARIVMTPDLKLEATRDLVKLRGLIGLPLVQIELEDLPAGSRAASSDVVVLNEDGSLTPKAGSKLDAELTITLGENVHFKGFGLNADLGGQLFVDQNPGKVATASGEIKIQNGSFRAYGQDLSIGEGRISYAGGRIDNPGMRLRASRKMDDITVGVQVSGTAKKPKVSTWSTDPDLAEKDIVSILLTGQRSDNLSEAKVYTGRQITKDLSVGVNLGGGKDGSEFVARYRLMDNVNVEGTSSARKSGVSINYTIEVE